MQRKKTTCHCLKSTALLATLGSDRAYRHCLSLPANHPSLRVPDQTTACPQRSFCAPAGGRSDRTWWWRRARDLWTLSPRHRRQQCLWCRRSSGIPTSPASGPDRQGLAHTPSLSDSHLLPSFLPRWLIACSRATKGSVQTVAARWKLPWRWRVRPGRRTWPAVCTSACASWPPSSGRLCRWPARRVGRRPAAPLWRR